MRILVAPDCFTGTLTAPQAATAMAQGWRRHAPHDTVELCPLSDGGPGFVEVLRVALGGRLLDLSVHGPLGEPTPATVLLVQGDDGVPVAYLEAAQACGLHLVPADRRDPGRTSTAGVGALLLAARAAGAARIVVGLGGSGTNDGGAGMLAALRADPALAPLPDRGVALDSRLAAGGAGLVGVTADELAALADLVPHWAGVELVIASDVDAPLLGFHGASAGYAAQKGASPDQAQQLERALGDFAAAVGRAVGVRTGTSSGLSASPGAGAAGGLGFGLALLGARRVAGVTAVLDAVAFADRVRHCDLVLSGEGTFDWQSLRGKVVAGVARAAGEIGTPVVVVAGQVTVGRREALAAGVTAAYPVASTPAQVEAAMADPVGTLAARVQRVARTWSWPT